MVLFFNHLTSYKPYEFYASIYYDSLVNWWVLFSYIVIAWCFRTCVIYDCCPTSSTSPFYAIQNVHFII